MLCFLGGFIFNTSGRALLFSEQHFKKCWFDFKNILKSKTYIHLLWMWQNYCLFVFWKFVDQKQKSSQYCQFLKLFFVNSLYNSVFILDGFNLWGVLLYSAIKNYFNSLTLTTNWVFNSLSKSLNFTTPEAHIILSKGQRCLQIWSAFTSSKRGTSQISIVIFHHFIIYACLWTCVKNMQKKICHKAIHLIFKINILYFYGSVTTT